MSLTLSVLRCPDAVPPETRSLQGGEFRIGRGPANDWVLADPERVLSKQHCIIAWRAGAWQIADTSTNGTFINTDTTPLGGGGVHTLSDGDRIRLGAYEIEARLQAEQQFAAPPQQRGGFNDPFGDDPFAAPSAPAPPESTDSWFGGGNSIALPGDFDPLGSAESLFGEPAADHAPAQHDAFRPAPMAPRLIPDDWDLGFSPPATSQPTTPPPPVPPVPSGPTPQSFSSFDEPELFPPPQAAPPGSPPLPTPPSPVAPASITPPSAPASPALVHPPADGDLITEFLSAAGMPANAQPADAPAAMRRLGGAFRAMVAGLRQAMIARASIKGEFRIEQTMIRARGNNPLKFSADDDDAMAALLGLGRRTDMDADAAVTDALRDIRLHEIAVMGAMQTGVRALLERFDPAALRAAAEQGRGLLPAQRKARAFDAFETLHGDITRALADDFDSVFGKAFARAYERALSEAEARDR